MCLLIPHRSFKMSPLLSVTPQYKDLTRLQLVKWAGDLLGTCNGKVKIKLGDFLSASNKE